MRGFGRFLQFAGLVILPLALVLAMVPMGRDETGRVQYALSTGQELLALAFGAAIFWIGRLLEGYAKR